MKKIEYIAPEMEIINVKVANQLLAGSDGSGSTLDPEDGAIDI